MIYTREHLIKKWLGNDLNQAEQAAFEQLEDYHELVKIEATAKAFKAPNFDTTSQYEALNIKKSQANKVKPLWPNILKVAGILVIALGAYFFFTYNPTTTITTGLAETKNLDLPNGSLVTLNSESTLSFNESQWDVARALTLEGEAFFDVTKGVKFTVETSQGTVTVLGTQFNVIQRQDWFEVVCYEGLVEVSTSQETVKLPPQRSVKLFDKTLTKGVEFIKTSHWLQGQSRFKALPYIYVIEELERQYNVTINSENIDLKKTFTGGFKHNDLDLALQSITQPMALSYSINGNNVTLKSIE